MRAPLLPFNSSQLTLGAEAPFLFHGPWRLGQGLWLLPTPLQHRLRCAGPTGSGAKAVIGEGWDTRDLCPLTSTSWNCFLVPAPTVGFWPPAVAPGHSGGRLLFPGSHQEEEGARRCPCHATSPRGGRLSLLPGCDEARAMACHEAGVVHVQCVSESSCQQSTPQRSPF